MSTAVDSSPEVESKEATPLEEALTPVLALFDQAEAEEKDLFEVYRAKKDERESIERCLRAGKMIAPKDPAKAKGGVSEEAMAALITPQPWPENERSIKVTQKVVTAIEALDGEEFQIAMLSRKAGADRRSVERAIGVMRGEDRIRVLGKRPPLGRDHPGGASAMTFKEIK